MNRALAAWLCLCLLGGAAACFAAPQACAHRGDNKCAPENTLPAFESAVKKRAAMIEFDVQMTKDGQLVIMHDATVNRTTDGSGKLAEMSFDEVRHLDAGKGFGGAFKGTKVPTLRETLDAIPNTILCNVHLKNGPKLAVETAKVLVEMKRLDHCFLACSTEQMQEARAVAPAIKTCNMSRQMGGRAAYVDATIQSGAQYIQILREEGLKGLKEDVARLHEHGVRVNWFNAQDETLIRALAEAGVDYILTDDLDLCQRVLNEQGNGASATAK